MNFFFDFLKGFNWKENLWPIITTVLVIVYTWFGAHFLRCHILLMTVVFTTSRGFTERNFQTIVTTVPVIVYTWWGAPFLRWRILWKRNFLFIFLFPQRVLFFDNHNYRTSQNIRERIKRASDQAYTMTSTVVMIVLKISFQWNPLKKFKKIINRIIRL